MFACVSKRPITTKQECHKQLRSNFLKPWRDQVTSVGVVVVCICLVERVVLVFTENNEVTQRQSMNITFDAELRICCSKGLRTQPTVTVAVFNTMMNMA